MRNKVEAKVGRRPHQFCIITAKPEELRYVKGALEERFDRISPLGSEGSEAVYLVQKPPRDYPITLMATCCSAMGTLHAAVKVAQVVTRYNPSVVLFLGTAASLDPSVIRLGDVIIPTVAWQRVYDKIVSAPAHAYNEAVADEGFRERFFGESALLARVATQELPKDATDLLSDFDPTRVGALEDGILGEHWLKRLPKARSPKVEDDIGIANCGMVVNSESYRDFLKGIAGRNVNAIDMESFGFFKAIDELQNADAVAQGIMIRGISDYAGRKEDTELGDTNWKRIANRNAAIVAAEFVRQAAARHRR